MRIDLYSLQLFVATCEEGTIGHAAMREAIAPSALSRRISDLEQMLNTTLFHRGSRGLELTASGRQLLCHARVISRDVAQMKQSFAAAAKGESGSVRFCANDWATAHHLPEKLSSFLSKYPNVEVRLDQRISSEAIRSLSENAVDFAIIGDEYVAPGITKTAFREEEWRVITPPDHPLARLDSVRLNDLLAFEFVAPSRGSAIDQLISREVERRGRVLPIRLRVAGFEAVAAMVETGFGIGILPKGWLGRFGRGMKLVSIPINEPWGRRRLVICIRDENELTPAARLLVDHLAVNESIEATLAPQM